MQVPGYFRPVSLAPLDALYKCIENFVGSLALVLRDFGKVARRRAVGNDMVDEPAAEHPWGVEYVTPAHYAEADDALLYYESLPEQQRLVLDLLAEGKSYAFIANYLGLSQSTVRTHVARVKAALGY